MEARRVVEAFDVTGSVTCHGDEVSHVDPTGEAPDGRHVRRRQQRQQRQSGERRWS